MGDCSDVGAFSAGYFESEGGVVVGEECGGGGDCAGFALDLDPFTGELVEFFALDFFSGIHRRDLLECPLEMCEGFVDFG